MNMIRLFLLFTTALLLTTNSYALNAVEQRYVEQLSKGGNVSIKQAAQSIYNTGLTNTEVLDVAAEVLLQKYKTATPGDVDTLAWVAKALGNSGNGRYHQALSSVAEGTSQRKLRKHANRALKQLGAEEGKQYQQGSVSLAKLKSSKPKTRPATKTNGKAGLDSIVAGMSMEEVYALIGPPTATTTYQTGKAWIPFNYKGGDTVRSAALYKGKGRVVFSKESHYNATMRVLEVIIDAGESGYP